MGEIGKYIYGIINSNPHTEDFGAGVYTIPYQDISAAVCEAEIVDYTYMLRDGLARLLVEHQEVIEGIMGQGYAIIPVRLGTYASDVAEVRDILNKGYRLIKEIMAKIHDKIEIDVCATWNDFPSVLKEVGQEREIKEFKEKLLANPEGITVDAQMKVGVMVKKALDEKRWRYAKEIEIVLRTVSQDCKAHELMDDKMVVNFAFLISKADQRDFERKVEELNTEFHDELNFRCVGPLPPYSFYTLEIKKMNFKEVDWASKKLGLNEFRSKDEIKKAYQRSAISTHPDKNPNTPGMEKEFDDVNRAYKILFDYCQACEQAGRGDGCSFDKDEFKNNAILVKVRE